jgi:hypothetical protein
MLADPGTKMPAQYQNIAEVLYDNFQSENWGEPIIQKEAQEDQLSSGKKVNAENADRKGLYLTSVPECSKLTKR